MELFDELFTLLVVHLGRIKVLRIVARDHIKVVDICVKGLHGEGATSTGSILRTLFSMVGKWNS